MDDILEDTSVERGKKSKINQDFVHTSPKKKKRQSKVKSRQGLVRSVLEELEDDVLDIGQSTSVEVEAAQNAVLEHATCERLFVQNKKGFEPATRDKVFHDAFHDLSGNNQMEIEKKELTPHEFALLLYQKTRQFFSFCHGILGGFAVAHMSLVWSIADNHKAIQSFAEGYPDFARVVQIVYYILSAICFVSVLDRCDFAGLQLVHCCDFVRHRIFDILTIFFYFGLLVVTVICVRWDDRLALSKHNEELWKDSNVSHTEFMQWKIFSLLRGFFAIAGYITMFFGPNDDLFSIHLSNMINYKEKDNNYENARY